MLVQAGQLPGAPQPSHGAWLSPADGGDDRVGTDLPWDHVSLSLARLVWHWSASDTCDSSAEAEATLSMSDLSLDPAEVV